MFTQISTKIHIKWVTLWLIELKYRTFLRNNRLKANNFIEELKWRGMIHDVMPGTEEALLEGMVID